MLFMCFMSTRFITALCWSLYCILLSFTVPPLTVRRATQFHSMRPLCPTLTKHQTCICTSKGHKYWDYDDSDQWGSHLTSRHRLFPHYALLPCVPSELHAKTHPTVSPTEATVKNVPKYLRNSLDQAICIAICLSLIWFCIRIWRSIYSHRKTGNRGHHQA